MNYSQRASQDIFHIVVTLADQAAACALGVVLHATGSTPGKIGSKMVTDGKQVLHGTIGGGWVEKAVLQQAASVIETGQPKVLDFQLENHELAKSTPVCGGSMRVLLDPSLARYRAAYAEASAIRNNRQRGALLTTLRHQGTCTVEVDCIKQESVTANTRFPGADAIQQTLDREKTALFASDPSAVPSQLEVLVEPLLPQPIVLLVGGGHVGQAVAVQANLVGFDIAVIDDRDQFARHELFPNNSTIVCGDIGKEVADFPIAADTYVVIATHGHKHDGDALAACIHRPAAYIGMIGSRRKTAMMRESFVDAGRCTAQDFDRVYAPIGLEIGATTPVEIATSIVAQMIAIRRTGSAPRFSRM